MDLEYDSKDLIENLEAFFTRNLEGNDDYRVIVITSGGTSVNLDRYGIRYIDNFSSGRRGSEIAEFFLSRGYLVLFLSRKTAHLPFIRFTNDHDNPYRLLESLKVGNDSSITVEGGSEFKELIVKNIEGYSKYKSRLFLDYFTTLSEYQDKFTVIVHFCKRFMQNVAYCLVAAASDFKFSNDSLMMDKFSSSNTVNLRLEPLLKMRKIIRQISDGYPTVCCFKMSTNRTEMENAAKAMLLKPTSADMIVCNIFNERLTNVSIVFSDGPTKTLESNVSSLSSSP
ncbi:phosphopantothenate--cysteine ligase (ATP) [Theileria orientalis]|uniref:Phosphopantothenate--cysteine ligase (ATP) n=1 Tax=Theileria orientalis TaxID=68886 RepID=A0A976M7X1_THEOR|nr:phosphopantothenate--cysteine ligase (ATP) [Theileria orientalis]